MDLIFNANYFQALFCKTVLSDWILSPFKSLYCFYSHCFVFTFSQLIQHRKLKILVPSTHNTLVIMWGREKKFQVLMLYELRNRKNKILL